jgi:hypothetical protein
MPFLPLVPPPEKLIPCSAGLLRKVAVGKTRDSLELRSPRSSAWSNARRETPFAARAGMASIGARR